MLVGDEARLRQVLLNLLSNAVKFTEAGGVRLQLHCARAGSDQVLLQVAVSDTGIGITETQRERLFHPFTQADASITRRFGGTGLGLSICDRLVRAMGSTIQVESAPGAGSTFGFELTLPVALPPDAPGTEDAAADAAPDGERLIGLRVLVVEDQPLNQELAATVLEGAGASVSLAGNGAEAVDQLRRIGPGGVDLVLMDLQMPVLDGYEATRRLRREPGFQDLPIIAMTAHALSGERARCRAVGMNDHIAKPIDLRRLFQVLRRWHSPTPNTPPAAALEPAVQDVSDTEPQAAASAGLEASPAPTPGHGSLDGIDFAAGLQRAGGDKTAYARLLRRFLREQGDAPARVRSAFGRGDLAAARRDAHALAGVALNLGLRDLGSAAREVEDAIAAEHRTPTAALTRLERAQAQALPQVEAFCERQEAAVSSPPPPDAVDWSAGLQRLDALLQDRNLRARQAIGELLAQAHAAHARSRLEQVAERIEDLDFDGARAALKLLIGVSTDTRS
jgi:CheY-like chemotaxis protein/HPt (histidine-containing phosphotransfer) domain-containing protein